MRPTEKDLSDLFDKINKEHFENKITKVPVIWNNRLRVCAGRCIYKTNHITETATVSKIDLSNKLFKNNNFNEYYIFNTLAHEMTHAYLIEHFGESGHTTRFHHIMTKITGEKKNHRCHSYNVQGLRNKQNITYSCRCGSFSGTRARMPKKGLRYIARCCMSHVEFKNISQDTFFKI